MSIAAQDAYWNALEWILALPFGAAFSRADLITEMRFRYMYPAGTCDGPCNLAIHHCLQRSEIIKGPNDRWMRL
jgi:hypothetical protein